MKITSLSGMIILWLVCSACLLTGCGNRTQTPGAQETPSQSQPGAQGQTERQQSKAADASLDDAGRIIAEAIKQHAATSGTPRTPAEVVAGAPPPPTLGERLGVTGRPFNSFAGGFVVTPPPGFPPFEQVVKKGDRAPIELHLFKSEFPGGAAAIILEYNDLPADVDTSSPQSLLERARAGGLEGVSGTLERQESLTIQGHPAISIYLSIPAEAQYARQDITLVQRRLYQMVYVTKNRAELDGPQVQAYFKSFQLLD